MILIDTGPIVALFDKDDKYHGLCVETLKAIDEPLVTTWAVLTETFYLLNFSQATQDGLWQFIERGGVKVESPSEKGFHRCREFMRKYKDLPMDLADATLVAIAEEMRLSTVFTLDRRDFCIYKPRHRRSFNLLPERV